MSAVYYVLLSVSAVLFSLQMLIMRIYKDKKGGSFVSVLKMLIGAYITVAVLFFVKNCIAAKSFAFGFSWFTLLISGLFAVVNIACFFIGTKVISVGGLSLYSVFCMLGNIILPVLTGVLIYDEKLSVLRIIALVIMAAALFFTVRGSEKVRVNVKAIIFYIAVFFLNGVGGVLYTVHQNHPELTAMPSVGENGALTVNSDVFVTWNGIATAVLCMAVYAVIYFVNRKKRAENGEGLPQNLSENVENGAEISENKKMPLIAALAVVMLPVLYGLCNGFGNFFQAIAISPDALGAAVTFPVINGGTILVSQALDIIVYKNKPGLEKFFGLLLVLTSFILYVL